ncbi:MAG: peptide-methionine (R)-S-oxide reductase [Gemmatimonadales bacterium]|nr:MAG: peptide-methionine (R)-S-oxide reductase [Gemmatimonadales bacterium]
MNRRHFLRTLGMSSGALLVLGPLAACRPDDEAFARDFIQPRHYWRDKVSEERWHILFEEGTERAFSSPLDRETRPGTYICAACHFPLFGSDTKYDSGTGWPSFWAPMDEDRVGTKADYKLILPRTEYHCARCGGHQGHVFEDGPEPTGERWCNNGLALHFIPEGEPLPELRGEPS